MTRQDWVSLQEMLQQAIYEKTSCRWDLFPAIIHTNLSENSRGAVPQVGRGSKVAPPSSQPQAQELPTRQHRRQQDFNDVLARTFNIKEIENAEYAPYSIFCYLQAINAVDIKC